jgi:protein subunit release factor A
MRLPITYRAFNSGGKGGQHGNRSLNAMELSVTLPDGRVIKAASTHHKSQWDNKRQAEKALKVRVKEALTPERERPDLTAVVRTYHQPTNMVRDHASGSVGSYKRIIDKDKVDDFTDLVDARRKTLSEDLLR